MLKRNELPANAYWDFFIQLNEIPRASKKEEAVCAYVKAFAKQRELEIEEDATGNLLIRKQASPGMEVRPVVALQGHLDMVHQKNASVAFDFASEGIRMMVDGEWLKAEGTTLGADNGLGVAYMLAVLDSDSLVHPRIEALFTIDEETGMTGAKGLQDNWLKAKYLLNIDTEEDDELTIGCAGGVDTLIEHSLDTEAIPETHIGKAIELKGLFGGHSGTDIHLGRANANKLLFRLLHRLQEQCAFTLCEVDGGGLRNAIPREAVAHISCAPGEGESIDKIVGEMEQVFRHEYSFTDPELSLSCRSIQRPAAGLVADDQKSLIHVLQATFNGIYRLSPEVADLVESSSNLARVRLLDGQLDVQSLQRSSRESAKWDVSDTVAAPFRAMGAQVRTEGSYPGWTPQPGSALVQLMTELHKESFGRPPRVLACHAGLECGLIGEAMPEMQMISFGPTIRNAHSPDECAHIASAEKVWDYLCLVLSRIN